MMVAIATLVAFGGASVVARAAAVDDAAAVQQPARRVEIPNNSQYPIAERPGRDMLSIINLARLERGLPIFFWDGQVATAAAAHSGDMAARRQLAHLGSDGSNTGDRLNRVGVAWSTWGENVGAGFDDPQVLFDAWVGSPSHAQHLFGDFTSVGVGVVATPDGVAYWTLVLAG